METLLLWNTKTVCESARHTKYDKFGDDLWRLAWKPLSELVHDDCGLLFDGHTEAFSSH